MDGTSGTVFSEISQVEKKNSLLSFMYGIEKMKQLVNVTKQKQTHRKQTSGYQLGERSRGRRGRDRRRAL